MDVLAFRMHLLVRLSNDVFVMVFQLEMRVLKQTIRVLDDSGTLSERGSFLTHRSHHILGGIHILWDVVRKSKN